MSDKDHLFTQDEYVREINRKSKILNSQQFAVTGPAGLGPYVIGTGLASRAEPIQERFEGRGNPIKDFGVVTLQTVNIDFDDLGTQYNRFKVDGDITFAFNNFPLDQAMPFVFDIELGVASPTITYPASVKNLPTNLPTGLGDRYDLLFWGFKDSTEERFYVIGGEGTATIPPGTAENQHLEWDNTGLKWDALQNMEFGAIGPFADSGFLRFANNQIMLSARNSTDNGNLEFKVTNNAPDFFDFTESANNEITLRIRAQHAVDPDQSFTIKQFSGIGAATQFDFPSVLNIVRGADLLISLPDANNIDFFEASDAFGFNLASAAQINMGALNALVFNQFATIGKSISRFTTGLHYDIENAAHIHLFRVSGAIPADAFHVSATEVQVYSPLDLIPETDGSLDLGGSTVAWGDLHIGRIFFQNNQGILATSPTIGSSSNALVLNSPTGNEIFLKIAGSDEYFFDSLKFAIKNLNHIAFLDSGDNEDYTISYLDPLVLHEVVGSGGTFKFLSETNVTPEFQLESGNSSNGLLAYELAFYAEDSLGTTNHKYSSIKGRIENSIIANLTGSLELNTVEVGGILELYMNLNGLFEEIQVSRDVVYTANANLTRLDISAHYLEMDALTAPTHSTATKRFLFQDIADNHMKIRTDIGLIDLETGGGNEFSDATFRIFDDIDNTRKMAFQTGGIATATTRTYTVPNRDGTIVVIDNTTGDLEVGADVVLGGLNRVISGAASGVYLELDTTGIDLVGLVGDVFRVTIGSNSFTYNGSQIDLNAGNIIDTGDIRIGAADRVRANTATEIGFFVTNSTVAVGGKGTVNLPFVVGGETTSAQADIDFGAVDGNIGIYGRSGTNPLLVIRNNGVWRGLIFNLAF